MEKKVVDRIYSLFKSEVMSENDPEKLIAKAEDFGLFCWSNYPPAYTDIEVELKLQSAMLPLSDLSYDKETVHYVYIATRLFEVGGHTRCIINFIDNLKEHKHSVILIDQRKKLPVTVSDFFLTNEVSVNSLKANSYLKKAQELRNKISEIKATRILLFTHPNDLLPMITFSNFHPCEIVLFNHADHTFWLGGKWIDKVIDFRFAGLSITRMQRNVSASVKVPLPVSEFYEKKNWTTGIPEDEQIIIGTLTNYSKIQASASDFSFVQFIINSAATYSQCRFVIIGLTIEQFKSLAIPGSLISDNIELTGVIPNPEHLYRSFDIFLEPFPIGSGLGIIEACKYGAIPVFTPHECRLAGTFEVFHENLSEFISPSGNFNQLIETLACLVHMNANDRKALNKKVQDCIYTNHRGTGWTSILNDSLENTFQETERMPVINPVKEADFFREYVKRTHDELFRYLLSMKNIINRKLLYTLFFGKHKVLSFKTLTLRNWKQLMLSISKP